MVIEPTAMTTSDATNKVAGKRIIIIGEDQRESLDSIVAALHEKNDITFFSSVGDAFRHYLKTRSIEADFLIIDPVTRQMQLGDLAGGIAVLDILSKAKLGGAHTIMFHDDPKKALPKYYNAISIKANANTVTDLKGIVPAIEKILVASRAP